MSGSPAGGLVDARSFGGATLGPHSSTAPLKQEPKWDPHLENYPGNSPICQYLNLDAGISGLGLCWMGSPYSGLRVVYDRVQGLQRV